MNFVEFLKRYGQEGEEIFTEDGFYSSTWFDTCPNCERTKLKPRRVVYTKWRDVFFFECQWCGEEYWIYGDQVTTDYNFRLLP